MIKNTIYTLGILLMVLMAACSTRAVVDSEEFAEVDFSAYNTFAYLPNGEPDTSEYINIYEESIIREVNYQMERRGYNINKEAPDLLVLVNAMLNEEQQLDRRFLGRNYDYYMPGFYDIRPQGPIYYADYQAIPGLTGTPNIRDVEFTEGTFIIDIVDASNNQIIWRGWARSPINPENIDSSIREYIDHVFEEYPVEAAGE